MIGSFCNILMSTFFMIAASVCGNAEIQSFDEFIHVSEIMQEQSVTKRSQNADYLPFNNRYSFIYLKIVEQKRIILQKPFHFVKKYQSNYLMWLLSKSS
ncbi:hypothetical protein J9303_11740 [Bacillaceae bacterium Marseille-Q3522]|nr:hypothetical protein [Bacillaceae bacterium Marseille-Q3522]